MMSDQHVEPDELLKKWIRANWRLETKRYDRATEELRDDDLINRMGGLFALEALAVGAPDRFAETVYEDLVSFLIEQTRPDLALLAEIEAGENQAARIGFTSEFVEDGVPIPEIPKVGIDVQAVLRILSRQRVLFDNNVGALSDDNNERGLVEKRSPTVGVHLVCVDLSAAWLRGSSFDRATLTNTDFHEACLTDTNFYKATITDTDFLGTALTNTSFLGAFLTNTSFYGATLTNTDFHEGGLTDTDFRGATLTRAYFSHAGLTSTDFHEATLTETIFRSSGLIDTNFCRTTLIDNDFYGARIVDANFSRASLTDTSFEGTTLTNISFRGARHHRTKFTGAILTNWSGRAAVQRPRTAR